MEIEMLKVFNEEYQSQGIASRDEVHKKGLWHETFHCWLVSKNKDTYFIYLQLRSKTKKDFPNLLDITAAGHLLENETVREGVREVEEELGINVAFKDLISLGVMKDCLVTDEIIDHELTNVFLLMWNGEIKDFRLQEDEVSGIVKVDLDQFIDLWSGKTDHIVVEGIDYKNNFIHSKVSLENFVPHETSYIKNVLKGISNVLNHY
ncbi:NUDIX domain-containing protein [Pontibacillus sp. HMF3514]|uniref:NUDIX hydrolase n=1 Tax=Pontibacillus sp. HMF3514 TaxID=2692425 RepID=UPI0013204237|nr:NUDIX domain-containing protein [Pontibacillus sp. HMF3514]QHE54133.1 NUDIX domain-containing protein [Pontibacillus sp. HMF3514]